MNTSVIDPAILEKANYWTSDAFDEATRKHVQQLIENNPEELVECFYQDLDFGTGGLRGIMGVGTNRINQYTLGMATQGLCNYLKAQHPGKEDLSVAIAHDSRNNSKTFARQVAEVFAANAIKAYLFEDLRPTPELSFAIRHLGCDSGIVLTASHNPKEYNGYKVYWNDGGQLVPPHDKGVINEVRKVAVEDIQFDYNDNLIEYIGDAIDRAYLDEVNKLSLNDAGKDDLKVVFTALHGTSIVTLPQALEENGFTQVTIVEEQATPDGNFPTVKSPNPEEAAALQLAVDKANEIDADLVIGCDPDADRVGLAVRGLNGEMTLLNGNQTGAMLINYMLHMHREKGSMPENPFIAETVVTSDLIEKIGDHYGVSTKKCLTGFKWIAEIIRNLEGKENYIVGGEESYGYLIGDFVRDKDAISAAVLLAEVAAWAKAKGSSFYRELIELYVRDGFYLERLISITKKGKAGLEEIQAMIEGFRANPPTQLGGSAVVEVIDYKTGLSKNTVSGEESKTRLPSSNFIQFITADGDKITARPSGTEPKIKFYFSVKSELESAAAFEHVHTVLNSKINRIVTELNLN